MKVPIDERVINHVNKLVGDGVSNANEMKRHIQLLVKSIHGDKTHKNSISRRFYPSRNDIRKMIYREKRRLQKGLLDQERLLVRIQEWEKEGTHDIFYRPSSEDQENTEKTSFLLVYQSTWQKRLLEKYGKEMVFLDATYKTTRYALPLFFLCVLTNSGYIVVGTVVIESEDSCSLAEALNKLKDMNPSWNSRCFMIDASEVEINAIKLCFPGKNSVFHLFSIGFLDFFFYFHTVHVAHGDQIVFAYSQ